MPIFAVVPSTLETESDFFRALEVEDLTLKMMKPIVLRDGEEIEI